MEIGLLFLNDSLAKTEIFPKASTDAEIENQTERLKKIIKKLGLNTKIVNVAKQVPVNMAVAKAYIGILSNMGFLDSKLPDYHETSIVRKKSCYFKIIEQAI